MKVGGLDGEGRCGPVVGSSPKPSAAFVKGRATVVACTRDGTRAVRRLKLG